VMDAVASGHVSLERQVCLRRSPARVGLEKTRTTFASQVTRRAGVSRTFRPPMTDIPAQSLDRDGLPAHAITVAPPSELVSRAPSGLDVALRRPQSA
jgi:hypothetical protein